MVINSIESECFILLCRCRIGHKPVKVPPSSHVLASDTYSAQALLPHTQSLWNKDPRIPLRSYEGCTHESNEAEKTPEENKNNSSCYLGTPDHHT